MPSADRAQVLWVSSWILAGAIGLSLVMAMEMSVPPSFYICHVARGVGSALLWAFAIRRNSQVIQMVAWLCFVLAGTIGGNYWTPSPAEANDSLFILRTSVAVVGLLLPVVSFSHFFVSRRAPVPPKGGTPNAKIP